MGSSGRPSVNKRNRETARTERTKDKLEDRKRRNAERQERSRPATGEDPDIAHIVPGPQPIPE